MSDTLRMDRALLGSRLESGDFHNMTIPERTGVRHYWATQVELGTRADTHDLCPSPYRNWGFSHYLDHQLAQMRERKGQDR